MGCWAQVADDEGQGKGQELRGVKGKLRDTRRLLEGVVGEDFGEARQRVVDEDETIDGLL